MDSSARTISKGMLVLLLAAAAGSGCRHAKPVAEAALPPPPPEAVVTLIGDADLNNGGRVAVVHLYQLSEQSALHEASLEAFWQDDRQSLGADVVRREELRLYPGDRVTRQLELEPATRYIGVAVNLAEPAPNGWRVAVPVAETTAGPIVIRIGADRLIRVQ